MGMAGLALTAAGEVAASALSEATLNSNWAYRVRPRYTRKPKPRDCRSSDSQWVWEERRPPALWWKTTKQSGLACHCRRRRRQERAIQLEVRHGKLQTQPANRFVASFRLV